MCLSFCISDYLCTNTCIFCSIIACLILHLTILLHVFILKYLFILSCGDAVRTNPASPPAPLQQSGGGSMLGNIGGAIADGKIIGQCLDSLD